MRSARRSDAFTLIELLMVVLIIGMLASIAVPTYQAQKTASFNGAAVSALRSAVDAAYGWQVQRDVSTWMNPDDGTGFSRIHLEEYEPSLYVTSPCEPQEGGPGEQDNCVNTCNASAPSPARPGPDADPTRVFIGRSATCTNPGDRPVMVLCTVSKGDSIYCAALDLTNKRTRWRRYKTSNPITALGDGVATQLPTYNTGGEFDIDDDHL